MMKKTLTVILVLAALATGAQAQSYKSAIGLRGGDPSGITFKTFINSTNALELIAGTGYWGHNFAITGFYQWQKPTDWTPNLDWFVGPGAHIGFWNDYYRDDYGTGILLGVDGIIGLEYTLDDIPLNFSLGIGPAIQLTSGPGFMYWNGGFSVRYIFCPF
jgi:opacity protein-like surface antigen